MIRVYLKVKFRAFGITFGTVEQAWNVTPPTTATPVVPPRPPALPFLNFNERGVTLVIGPGV